MNKELLNMTKAFFKNNILFNKKSKVIVNKKTDRLERSKQLISELPQRMKAINKYGVEVKFFSKEKRSQHGATVVQNAVEYGMLDNVKSEVDNITALAIATEWAKKGYKKISASKVESAEKYRSWIHVLKVVNPRYFDENYYPLGAFYGAIRLYIEEDLKTKKKDLYGCRDVANQVNDAFYGATAS